MAAETLSRRAFGDHPQLWHAWSRRSSTGDEAAAHHRANKDRRRTEIIVSDSAHGTNPASAVLGGYTVKTVASGPDGRVDLSRCRWENEKESL